MAFLVADGHGGPEAATFCCNELFECLAKYAEGASSKALAAAATKAFSEVHQRVVEETSNAGTTATLVMINETRGELTCASVGDSFAMLMSAPPESITESRPDAPPPPPEQISCNDRLDDNKAERERVIAQGGRLRRSTNSRVRSAALCARGPEGSRAQRRWATPTAATTCARYRRSS